MSSNVVAVNKADRVRDKIKSAVVSASIMLANPTAYCSELNVNNTLSNVMKLIFGIMQFGGFAFIGYGAIKIAKHFSNPDEADGRGMSQGIGLIVGGVIMVAVKWVIKAVTGQDPTNFNIGVG